MDNDRGRTGGIAAVGRLIDHRVTPAAIARVDPAFEARDMGQKWRAVSNECAPSMPFPMDCLRSERLRVALTFRVRMSPVRIRRGGPVVPVVRSRDVVYDRGSQPPLTVMAAEQETEPVQIASQALRRILRTHTNRPKAQQRSRRPPTNPERAAATRPARQHPLSHDESGAPTNHAPPAIGQEPQSGRITRCV